MPVKVDKSQKHLNILHGQEFRPITYDLKFYVFSRNILCRHLIAEKLHLILMKTTIFWVGIQEMLSGLIEDPPKSINIVRFVGIDLKVI